MESMYLKAEDLQKFWNEHRSECGDDFLRVKNVYDYDNRAKRYTGLEVSGFTVLLQCVSRKIRCKQLFI